ncbi:MAG: tRNA (guanosine(46)-N7)-methyltransferase TrmB [Eubacteriales bacterium]
MRLRNIKGSKEIIESSSYVIVNYQGLGGQWNSIFSNEHPIHLEIGMGKGKFLVDSALRNPHINYIGVERYSSVLCRAVQKVSIQEEIRNLRFIAMDAGELLTTFSTKEVDKIYLHFSDPWPKDRHARRRLNSKEYLAIYGTILKEDGVLELKTDNLQLFEFGIEEAKVAGWTVNSINRNLHTQEYIATNPVMTEYEKKFGSAGNPILQYKINKGYQ